MPVYTLASNMHGVKWKVKLLAIGSKSNWFNSSSSSNRDNTTTITNIAPGTSSSTETANYPHINDKYRFNTSLSSNILSNSCSSASDIFRAIETSHDFARGECTVDTGDSANGNVHEAPNIKEHEDGQANSESCITCANNLTALRATLFPSETLIGKSGQSMLHTIEGILSSVSGNGSCGDLLELKKSVDAIESTGIPCNIAVLRFSKWIWQVSSAYSDKTKSQFINDNSVGNILDLSLPLDFIWSSDLILLLLGKSPLASGSSFFPVAAFRETSNIISNDEAEICVVSDNEIQTHENQYNKPEVKLDDRNIMKHPQACSSSNDFVGHSDSRLNKYVIDRSIYLSKQFKAEGRSFLVPLVRDQTVMGSVYNNNIVEILICLATVKIVDWKIYLPGKVLPNLQLCAGSVVFPLSFFSENSENGIKIFNELSCIHDRIFGLPSKKNRCQNMKTETVHGQSKNNCSALPIKSSTISEAVKDVFEASSSCSIGKELQDNNENQTQIANTDPLVIGQMKSTINKEKKSDQVVTVVDNDSSKFMLDKRCIVTNEAIVKNSTSSINKNKTMKPSCEIPSGPTPSKSSNGCIIQKSSKIQNKDEVPVLKRSQRSHGNTWNSHSKHFNGNKSISESKMISSMQNNNMRNLHTPQSNEQYYASSSFIHNQNINCNTAVHYSHRNVVQPIHRSVSCQGINVFSHLPFVNLLPPGYPSAFQRAVSLRFLQAAAGSVSVEERCNIFPDIPTNPDTLATLLNYCFHLNKLKLLYPSNHGNTQADSSACSYPTFASSAFSVFNSSTYLNSSGLTHVSDEAQSSNFFSSVAMDVTNYLPTTECNHSVNENQEYQDNNNNDNMAECQLNYSEDYMNSEKTKNDELCHLHSIKSSSDDESLLYQKNFDESKNYATDCINSSSFNNFVDSVHMSSHTSIGVTPSYSSVTELRRRSLLQNHNDANYNQCYEHSTQCNVGAFIISDLFPNYFQSNFMNNYQSNNSINFQSTLHHSDSATSIKQLTDSALCYNSNIDGANINLTSTSSAIITSSTIDLREIAHSYPNSANQVIGDSKTRNVKREAKLDITDVFLNNEMPIYSLSGIDKKQKMSTNAIEEMYRTSVNIGDKSVDSIFIDNEFSGFNYSTKFLADADNRYNGYGYFLPYCRMLSTNGQQGSRFLDNITRNGTWPPPSVAPFCVPPSCHDFRSIYAPEYWWNSVIPCAAVSQFNVDCMVTTSHQFTGQGREFFSDNAGYILEISNRKKINHECGLRSSTGSSRTSDGALINDEDSTRLITVENKHWPIYMMDSGENTVTDGINKINEEELEKQCCMTNNGTCATNTLISEEDSKDIKTTDRVRKGPQCHSETDIISGESEQHSTAIVQNRTITTGDSALLHKFAAHRLQPYPHIMTLPSELRGGYNLNAFYTCTTPAAYVGIQTKRPGEPYHFSVSCLWSSLEEASTYGLEVPFVDIDGICTHIVYVPYLSALHIHTLENVERPAVEFVEVKLPYQRRPLYQQIKRMSEGLDVDIKRLDLFSTSTEFLASNSWLCIYWQPVHRDYSRSQTPSFLVYYWLRAVSPDGHNPPKLQIFGIVPYKINFKLWTTDSDDDVEATKSYFYDSANHIEEWLKRRGINHPDFEFIKQRISLY